MGSVFEARHRITGEARALKIIKPELSANKEFIERFLREVRVAATMRHENLVRVMEPGMDGNAVFLPMELLRGETLASLLHRVKRLSPPDAASVLLCVSRGVSAIHGKGVLHRDIKPLNIFLAVGDGVKITPKLLDFGLARELADTEHTKTGFVGGSPHYMAPEQAAGSRNLTERVDQYSLGVVAYQMVTGQRPYEDDDNQSALSKLLRGAPFPNVTDVDRTIPLPVARAIHRALSPDPEARFPSVGAFITALAAPVAAHLGSVSAIEALRGKALEMMETSRDERFDFDNTMIASLGNAEELIEGLEPSCAISTPAASTPAQPIAGQDGTMILESLDSCVIEMVPSANVPTQGTPITGDTSRVAAVGSHTTGEESTSIVIPRTRMPLIIVAVAALCLFVGGAIGLVVLVLGKDAMVEEQVVPDVSPAVPTVADTPTPPTPMQVPPAAEPEVAPPAMEAASAVTTVMSTEGQAQSERRREERRQRRAERERQEREQREREQREREQREREQREREAAAMVPTMVVTPPPTVMSNQPCVPMNGIPCID